jgi:hypothetical protein
MAFSRGELSVRPVRTLAVGCHAAAREAGGPAAVAVARACGQAAAFAHLAAHARAVPSYVLRAVALAHPGDRRVLDGKAARQRARLP